MLLGLHIEPVSKKYVIAIRRRMRAALDLNRTNVVTNPAPDVRVLSVYPMRLYPVRLQNVRRKVLTRSTRG